MKEGEVNEEATAYNAKTHLPELLRKVESGKRILITRRGKPVAKLVPVSDPVSFDAGAAREMKALRARIKLPKGTSVRNLIDEGRKY